MDNVLSVAFCFGKVNETIKGRRHYTQVYLAFCLFYYIMPKFAVLYRLNVYGWRYVVGSLGSFNC